MVSHIYGLNSTNHFLIIYLSKKKWNERERVIIYLFKKNEERENIIINHNKHSGVKISPGYLLQTFVICMFVIILLTYCISFFLLNEKMGLLIWTHRTHNPYHVTIISNTTYITGVLMEVSLWAQYIYWSTTIDIYITSWYR